MSFGGERASATRKAQTAPARQRSPVRKSAAAAKPKSRSPSPQRAAGAFRSPGGGNFIVNPKTLRTISKVVSDSKNGGTKANPKYEELFTDMSQSKLGGSVAEAVKSARSYSTKAEADVAAQEARDAAPKAAKGANAKFYYHISATGKHTVTQTRSAGAVGPFDSREEAAMAQYEARVAAGEQNVKKPTAQKRADNPANNKVRWALIGTVMRNGRATNDWRVVIDKNGKQTATYSLLQSTAPDSLRTLYSEAQKAAMTAEKRSSSARPAARQPSEAEIQQLVNQAPANKREAAQKAASTAGRSAAQRAAAVRLILAGAAAKASGVEGAICAKSVVGGKAVGQPVIILKSDGSLGSAAYKLAGLGKDATDAQVRKAVRALFQSGQLQQVFGTNANSKCALRGSATAWSEL